MELGPSSIGVFALGPFVHAAAAAAAMAATRWRHIGGREKENERNEKKRNETILAPRKDNHVGERKLLPRERRGPAYRDLRSLYPAGSSGSATDEVVTIGGIMDTGSTGAGEGASGEGGLTG